MGRRKKRKYLLRKGFALIILVFILLVAIFLFTPAAKTSGTMTASVDATDSEIVTELYKEGYIDGLRYQFLSFAGRLSVIIKSGSYALREGMTGLDILLQLASPGERWIRVAEGSRKEEIADILASNFKWSEADKKEFENIHVKLRKPNLEGRYYPSDYLISENDNPSKVAEEMVKRFEDEVENYHKNITSEIINFDKVIIIASLIQREAGGKKDMQLISGIIWNRLFKGMSLDIDASLQYARGTSNNNWWPRVASRDKDIDSPFNTYLYKGVPPTPISNPGKDAIDAAFNPVATPCLFYIHDKKGNIHCSKTYDEHEAMIEKYLK